MSKDNALPWSEEEIVRHYRTAKNPESMIVILAQLNAVDTARIKQVLRRNGVKIHAAQKDEPQKKERKPRTPKVFLVFEHGGVSYSINDIVRMTGRSVTYINARVQGSDTVTFGGAEYKITRYKKWGKKIGLCEKITAGAEES